MLPHCDFDEQVTTSTEDGTLRPDLVVRLPGGKQVVVDAKVPLSAYLEAQETTDDEVRAATPSGSRAPGTRAPPEARGEVLLATVRRQPGVGRHVPARRRLLPRRVGARPEPRRDGRAVARAHRVADNADRAPAGDRARLAAGEGRRGRTRRPRARARAVRAHDRRRRERTSRSSARRSTRQSTPTTRRSARSSGGFCPPRASSGRRRSRIEELPDLEPRSSHTVPHRRRRSSPRTTGSSWSLMAGGPTRTPMRPEAGTSKIIDTFFLIGAPVQRATLCLRRDRERRT